MTVKIVEFIMYAVAAFGIGAAAAGIYSVARALARKQDQLYQQKYKEFQKRKDRVDEALNKHA